MGHANKAERAIILLALCLLVGIPVFRWYQTSDAGSGPTLAAFTARLDQQVPALMKDYSIPGVAIALVEKGKVAWSKAYGYADVARARPMTTDTLLMAQSISKPVTAWGVMKLVQEGKIGLDEPVTKYIAAWRFPKSGFPAEEVTVRRLLSLSAGLPLGNFSAQYAPGEATPPLRETLSGDHVRLLRPPGSAFSYSNTSYALLELLVQEVTGRDFAEYMQEEVLNPLAMNHSSFTRGKELSTTVATGYDLKSRPVPPYIYPYRASGGLHATVGDLARFVCAGLLHPEQPDGRAVLTKESVEQLYAPAVKIYGMFGAVFDAYGLGHFVETLPDGRQAVWHGGQGKGWMTHFHSVPEAGAGIVILTNSQRSWPFFSILLRDWAKWNGFASVGMGNIIRAEPGMQVLVGLLLLASLWQAWRLGYGVARGARRFAPVARRPRRRDLGLIGFAAVLVGGVWWSVSQPYLFIDSIFPVLSGWLRLSLLSVAAVSLASACIPEVPGALGAGDSAPRQAGR